MKKTLMLVLALLMICPYVTLAQTRPHWLDISNKPLFPIDVTNYGVSTTNTLAENDAAFLLAIAAATTASKSLYIPAGKFSYSTALSIPYWMSITGEGETSILNPVGCDGILLPPHTYPAPPRSFGIRSFRDFSLNGDTSNPAYRGIVFVGADTLGPRLLNTTIERVAMNGFDIGIYLKNAWDTIISANVIRCSNSIVLEGQNIKTDIVSNTLIPPEIAGTSSLTNTHGIYYTSYSGYTVGERRPEDIQIYGNLMAGYDYAVKGTSSLHAMIENNDMETMQISGVSLLALSGKTVVSKNWISLDGTAASISTGIIANSVASPISGLEIQSNYIILNTPASATNAIAIASLGNHNNSIISNNELNGFNYGIKVTNSTGSILSGNNIVGLYPGVSTAILTNFLFNYNITGNFTNGPIQSTAGFNGVINGNTCATGPQLIFIPSATPQNNINIGPNWGATPTVINDTYVLNPGVASVTLPLTLYGATWDNQGCVPQIKELRWNNDDVIYGTVSTSALTIYRTTTTATTTVYFELGTIIFPE